MSDVVVKKNSKGEQSGCKKCICEICGLGFKQLTNTHLKKHGITLEDYKLLYPNSITDVRIINRPSGKDHYTHKKGYKKTKKNYKKRAYKPCPICGNMFEYIPGASFERKCCSRECGNKAGAIKRTKNLIYTCICEWCGHDFQVSSVKYKKKFCSDECRNNYQSSIKIGDNNPMKNPVTAAKNGDTKRGVLFSPERKLIRVIGWNNKPEEEKVELYEDHSIKMLQHFIDYPEEKERMRQMRLNQKPKNKNTSIELKTQKILTDNGYQFETQIPLLNMCIPDIVFKDEKVIIQCDGDYWHNYPNGLDKDYRQDKILKANGWQVIRFWEHEINNDIDGCLELFEWETFRRFHD